MEPGPHPPAGLLTVPAVSPSRPPLSRLSRGQHRGWRGDGARTTEKLTRPKRRLPELVPHLDSSRAMATEPPSPATPTRQQAPRRLQKTKVKLNNNDQQEVAGRRIRLEGQSWGPITGPAPQGDPAPNRGEPIRGGLWFRRRCTRR
ncbi:hypothetical protein OJAV_G00117550 [Oryzias javanicus]|uniref:Uncharacterized protein n=1 Tax=Oryzias javanicus TaxID=123683 RepID=A0A3S2MS31_ORYJA|nr:hypothetical protein OJAV_G00117550 [Oryzias javanicus]